MERTKCPYCGEPIAATAKKCRFCGEWLPNAANNTQQAARRAPNADPQSRQTSLPGQQPGMRPMQQGMQQRPTTLPPNANPMAAHPHQARTTITNPYQQQGNPGVNNPYRQPQNSYQQPQNYVQQYNNVQEAEEIKEQGFFDAYFMDTMIRSYIDFSGLCSRKDYWFTYLALLIISFGVSGLALIIGSAAGLSGMLVAYIILGLFSLALLVPGLAIGCRRLRDAGLSSWLILVSLVPILGTIALIIMFCMPTKYEHEETAVKFDKTDAIVSGACLVSIVAGVCLFLNAMSSLWGTNSGYDLGGDDYSIEETTNNDSRNSYVTEEPQGVTLPSSGSISQFSYLSTNRLSRSNLDGFSQSELRILRNAIYAMHDYAFKSPDIQQYFGNFHDYTPLYTQVDLSSIESYNVNLIKSCE